MRNVCNRKNPPYISEDGMRPVFLLKERQGEPAEKRQHIAYEQEKCTAENALGMKKAGIAYFFHPR